MVKEHHEKFLHVIADCKIGDPRMDGAIENMIVGYTHLVIYCIKTNQIPKLIDRMQYLAKYFDDENGDTVSKLEIDTMLLTDRVSIINDKIRKTPWYKVIDHLKLYKDLRDVNKEADEIAERLRRVKRNPVEIIKRS